MLHCRKLFIPILIALLTAAGWTMPADSSVYEPPADQSQLPIIKGKKVRNIILLIGDGMSVSTVSYARIKGPGVAGALHMDRMPIAGFVRTSSADNLITDSAAASSAMACGIKTNNGRISRTPNGAMPLSIMAACKAKGMATGLVATSSVTHATPAGFGAHTMSRKEQPLIAEHLLLNEINVMLGGGYSFFIPKSEPGSRRADERNLLDLARSKNYAVIRTREELMAARGPRVLGLFAEDGMQTMRPEPTIAEMTARAIDLLKESKKGFFIMIEGSQIDWANHEHNAENSVRQTLDFDMAVAEALKFAQKDKHTLVVVTADHETGGLSINGGKVDGSEVDLHWSTDGHSGATVPLYAYGPGAQLLSGFHENTDIPKVFARLLKIENFPAIIEKAPAEPGQ